MKTRFELIGTILALLALAITSAASAGTTELASDNHSTQRLAQAPFLSTSISQQFEERAGRYDLVYPSGTPWDRTLEEGFHILIETPAEVEKALRELKVVAFSDSINRVGDKMTVNEFERLKDEIEKRGYQLQTQMSWRPQKYLSIDYKDSHRGPVLVRDKEAYYEHDMNFSLGSIYEPKGQVLRDETPYPNVELRGSIQFRCAERYERCTVFRVNIGSASVFWVTNSRFPIKGGNSSAGGRSGK